MTAEGIGDERLKDFLERAKADASAAAGRRRWPRFPAQGEVRFTRPLERAEHAGQLAEVSQGGLAFLTDVEVSAGEMLRLSWEENGSPRTVEAAVESIHSHPKDRRVLVGVKFVK